MKKLEEFFLRGTKTSIACNPAKFVVFVSNTGPNAHIITEKHTPIGILDCREVVCTLCIPSVRVPSLLLEGLVTKC